MQDPVRHQYHPENRAEVFDLVRASVAPEISARVIAQWAWKYEASPYNRPEGPTVDIIRIGSKLVALVAGFRVKMSMGGIACFGECRSEWLVHPAYRGNKIWQRLPPMDTAEVLFGWSMVKPRHPRSMGWSVEATRPLLRLLDMGPIVEQFTHRPWLASLGTGGAAAARIATSPFRRANGRRGDGVVRLEAFDTRADRLSERARRAEQAMVMRDHHYLNWRYCQRTDATYMLFGVERGAELAGFMVARAAPFQGMPWGYLVDFLVEENSGDVLSSLIAAAIDEFRRLGVAAISCYATDSMSRRRLVRHGFLPLPKLKPVHFNRLIKTCRMELRRFATLRQWYVTMGDGDLEMYF